MALTVAGCGGGGGDTKAPQVSIPTVTVVVEKHNGGNPATAGPDAVSNREGSSNSAGARTKPAGGPGTNTDGNGQQLTAGEKLAAEKGSGGGGQRSAPQKTAAARGSGGGAQQSAAEKKAGG